MERFQLSLAQRLTELGCFVNVVSLRGGGALRAAFEAVGATTGEVVEPRGGHLSLISPNALAAHLRAQRADVVHSVSGVWLPSARAARLAGNLGLVQAQHGREPRRGWRDRLVLWLASRDTHELVAVSHEVIGDTLALSGARSIATQLIANGLPLPRPRETVDREARDGWGLPRDSFVVGCLARFDAVKNIPLLVRAVAALHARRPDLNVHLVLAGDGAEMGTVRAEVARTRLEGRVHLPGMIADPTALLRVVDACVLASSTEGTPMSLIEAMALGVPVLATKVGGIPELLAQGKAGRLVVPDDEAALGLGLAQLHDDAQVTRALAQAARIRVEQVYDINAVADRYIDCYERAIRAARRN